MKNAKTPHFMQMHSGEIDTDRLASFAEQNSNVDDNSLLRATNFNSTATISHVMKITSMRFAQNKNDSLHFRKEPFNKQAIYKIKIEILLKNRTLIRIYVIIKMQLHRQSGR